MNVLVTGSAGYIGPVAVAALRRAGHTVLGYDLGWFDTSDEPCIDGDIRTPTSDPAWADVVVHLAGLSNDPMGDLDWHLTDEINGQGTWAMVLHHRRARHVAISSCAVYGQAAEICTEESLVNPQSRYAVNKAWIDLMLHLDTRGLGGLRFNAVSLRLGTVYGYGPNHRLDLVVNKMAWDAINAGGVRVLGNAARPLTHIDDVASAIVWAVEGSHHGIYNIVGENVRMRPLAREIAAFASVPVQREKGDTDPRDYMASGQKALRAGWSPTHTVAGSLPVLFERTITLPPNGEYVRLTTLRRLIDEGVLDPKTLRSAA